MSRRSKFFFFFWFFFWFFKNVDSIVSNSNEVDIGKKKSVISKDSRGLGEPENPGKEIKKKFYSSFSRDTK